MSIDPRAPTTAGSQLRRFGGFVGLFFDDFAPDSAWIRERGLVRLPPTESGCSLLIRGEYRPHPSARGIESGAPGLQVRVNGRKEASLAPSVPGPWELSVALPESGAVAISLQLVGCGLTNLLAYLGRVTRFGPWRRFRAQHRNRQLRITTIASSEGEVLFDFSRREASFSIEYVRRHARLGLNIVGFLTADLGVGESARCMVRAADAAGLPMALVPLKLPCKNPLGDRTFASRLQDDNPHPVNVIHLDPPASRDLDHHHGRGFRAGKYNIAYFAWELPEFPDAWTPAFDYYDEVWCPSDFTAAALAMKSPRPVLAMPHAISFAPPTEEPAALRRRFGLPENRFLFLTLLDLNSYAARKNPRAAIAAFRRSGLVGKEAGLVIKLQNIAGNESDFAALQKDLRDLPGTVLLTETLARTDIYALEAACDCLVSLHRAEGFGLAVAESMFLGRPVIATNWSATAEYLDDSNGCPVNAHLVTLERNHGPYARGSTWAEPDLEHAALQMRRLFEDRALAGRLGAEARLTIRRRFAPPIIGARYRKRLESIATF